MEEGDKTRLDGQSSSAQLTLKDRALSSAAEGITISDPSMPDNPIIYANDGFERLTGYTVAEVQGKNCRFLQGAGTDEATVEEIRAALREEREVTVQILNYRKDGTPFWNRLSITPVRDADGRVTHFIGIQSDITEQKRAEEALEEANEQLRRDLEAAARVQRALLPDRRPQIEGLNIAWDLRSCTALAGDFLDFHLIGDDSIAFYVLDVSGHGAASALLSVTASRFLSPTTRRSIVIGSQQDGGDRIVAADPATVIERLGESFRFDTRTAKFFTLFYAVLHRRTGILDFASAGHPPAIHLPVVGEARELEVGGHPIGLLDLPRIRSHRAELAVGDRLYLYTDGVVEATNNDDDQFGYTRLRTTIETVRDLTLAESVSRIFDTVDDWRSARPIDDDISILAIERTADEH